MSVWVPVRRTLDSDYLSIGSACTVLCILRTVFVIRPREGNERYCNRCGKSFKLSIYSRLIAASSSDSASQSQSHAHPDAAADSASDAGGGASENAGHCSFHWGKMFSRTDPQSRLRENRYTCCNGDGNAAGCEDAPVCLMFFCLVLSTLNSTVQ